MAKAQFRLSDIDQVLALASSAVPVAMRIVYFVCLVALLVKVVRHRSQGLTVTDLAAICIALALAGK